MHGRLKVRTSEEQQRLKQIEQQKKLQAYRDGMQMILATRSEVPYNQTSFAICSQILCSNPDVYTLWNYRKEVTLQEIEESKKELKDQEALAHFMDNELKLAEQCLIANPKSYGAWHHRYWTLRHHPKPNWDKEFLMITKYLTMDDRNFHAWDYRRLILTNLGFDLEAEMKFSTDRINENFSNYSSWHYRSTLRALDAATIEQELRLVQSAVFTDPYDSSTWFYLRWVLNNQALTDEHRQSLLQDFNQLLDLEPNCKWIYMAKCWIRGSLSLKNTDEIAENVDIYKQLQQLDPERKGQYSDFVKCVAK